MKFEVHGATTIVAPIVRLARPVIIDDDAPLPNNIIELDELADRYYTNGDVASYIIAAEACNKLAGFERWDTPKKIKLYGK